MKVVRALSFLVLMLTSPATVLSDISDASAVLPAVADNSLSDTSAKVVGPVRVQKCCEFDSLLVEVTLGRRECKRRADILHVDIDVTRRKWQPTFFDPDSGMEIPGPEKYVLEIGVPSCQPHETQFAVFHHQVRKSQLGFRIVSKVRLDQILTLAAILVPDDKLDCFGNRG